MVVELHAPLIKVSMSAPPPYWAPTEMHEPAVGQETPKRMPWKFVCKALALYETLTAPLGPELVPMTRSPPNNAMSAAPSLLIVLPISPSPAQTKERTVPSPPVSRKGLLALPPNRSSARSW
jgi:hypothetical protein